MIFKPFARQGRQITLDDFAIEQIMPNLRPHRAWHVLCFIIFKTEGYDKDRDKVSYSQIMQGCGIGSTATVAACLKALIDSGYIIAHDTDDQGHPISWRDGVTYSLNTEYEVDVPAAAALETKAGIALKTKAVNNTALKTKASRALKTKAQNGTALKTKAESASLFKDTDDDKIHDDKEHEDTFSILYSRFAENFKNRLGPRQAELLGDLVDDPDIPNEWIVKAVDQTCIHQPAVPFPYFQSVLKNYIASGGPEAEVNVQNSAAVEAGPEPLDPIEEIWQRMAGLLRGQMTQATFDANLARANLLKPNGRYCLAVDTEQQRDRIAHRLNRQILAALQAVTGEPAALDFVVRGEQ